MQHLPKIFTLLSERDGHEIIFTGLSAGGEYANHLTGHFHIDGRPSGMSGNIALPTILEFEKAASAGRPRGITSAVLLRGITTHAHFEMHRAFLNLLDEDQKPKNSEIAEKAVVWGAIYGFERESEATIDRIKNDDARKKLLRDKKCGAEHVSNMCAATWLPVSNGSKRTAGDILKAIWFATPRSVVKGSEDSPVWVCRWGQSAVSYDAKMPGIAQFLRVARQTN